MRRINITVHVYPILLTAIFFSPGHSQETVTVGSELNTIRDNIYQVTNVSGGNVVVMLDEDSKIVVDTGSSAEDAEKIQSAISALSDKPIRFVVNTHWHSDHVGGNERMHDLGATIIAHDNVKQRMLTDQYIEFLDRRVPRAQENALPRMTFSKDLKLGISGNEIHIFQIRPGHTDTDAVVFFESADVIHVGDLYFNGLYPYICISSGGSINGVIAVSNTILSMITENTIVVPGHGPLSNRAEMKTYVDMLTTIRDRIQAQIKEGKTLDEITASKPTKEFDDPWGKPWLKAEDFVRLVYTDLKRDTTE